VGRHRFEVYLPILRLILTQLTQLLHQLILLHCKLTHILPPLLPTFLLTLQSRNLLRKLTHCRLRPTQCLIFGKLRHQLMYLAEVVGLFFVDGLLVEEFLGCVFCVERDEVLPLPLQLPQPPLNLIPRLPQLLRQLPRHLLNLPLIHHTLLQQHILFPREQLLLSHTISLRLLKNRL
jgi:hypothetical protein